MFAQHSPDSPISLAPCTAFKMRCAQTPTCGSGLAGWGWDQALCHKQAFLVTAMPAKSQRMMSLPACRTPQCSLQDTTVTARFSSPAHPWASQAHLSTAFLAVGVSNLSPNLHRKSISPATPCPLNTFLAIVTRLAVMTLKEEHLETLP